MICDASLHDFYLSYVPLFTYICIVKVEKVSQLSQRT